MDLSQIEELQEFTALWKMKKLSSDVFSQVIRVVKEFHSLFMASDVPNLQEVLPLTLRDLGEFVKAVLKKYLEKVRTEVLGKQLLEPTIVAECLRILWKDIEGLSRELPSSLSGATDPAHETTEVALRHQLDLRMRELVDHVTLLLHRMTEFP